MGLRFRKSINIGKHFRVNLSKKGVGYSYGVKGYRHTVSADGKEKDTFTIPGTGISHVSSSGKNDLPEQKQPVGKPYLVNKIMCYLLGVFLLILAVGFALFGNVMSVIFSVIFSFVFFLCGKKAQWDYEDKLNESIKDNKNDEA